MRKRSEFPTLVFQTAMLIWLGIFSLQLYETQEKIRALERRYKVVYESLQINDELLGIVRNDVSSLKQRRIPLPNFEEADAQINAILKENAR